MIMYAIVKTGGKQYRVQEGQNLLVERLRRDGRRERVADPAARTSTATRSSTARTCPRCRSRRRSLGHERGPKLRIVKFKPKRGYKRRNGHRQELTRIEITHQAGRSSRSSKAKAAAEETEDGA